MGNGVPSISQYLHLRGGYVRGILARLYLWLSYNGDGTDHTTSPADPPRPSIGPVHPDIVDICAFPFSTQSMPAVFLACREGLYRPESCGTFPPATSFFRADERPPPLFPPRHQPDFRPIRPPEQVANRLTAEYLQQRLRRHRWE